MQWPCRGERAYGFLVIPNQQLHIFFYKQTKWYTTMFDTVSLTYFIREELFILSLFFTHNVLFHNMGILWAMWCTYA